MKGYLADYGVDLEVYAYWVWRYYPDWLIWWQDYGSQANQESGATAEGAATAVDSAQGESATAVLPQLCILQDCLRVLTTSVKVVQDDKCQILCLGGSGHMPKDLAFEGVALDM